MLHTTFNLAHKSNACVESYRKMAKALGGLTKYGKDAPFGLDKVLEVCGLDDAIWCFQCTTEPSENILIEFACRCAEHVLHFYEDKYPDDKRPRKAIEAARVCITDKSPAARAAAWATRDAAWAAAWAAARDAAWAAAGDAAWAAARAAAWDARAAAWDARAAAWDAARAAAWATRDAARDAAWAAEAAARAAGDAEIEWQKQTFLELIGK
jgi:hypothetical protein